MEPAWPGFPFHRAGADMSRRTEIGALICWLCLATLASAAPPLLSSPKALAEARNRMVDEEIVAAGVKNRRVIDSMRNTPRHEFVPARERGYSYFDMALPIGEGQTISPPFVVAYMTEQIDPQPTDKVLEIGTGSGFQAAVLSPLVKDVYSIEIVKPLGETAAKVLRKLKYNNVHTLIGDGYQGWPEHAPFDKIIVTCSPEKVPPKLVEQLREGGRMIVPVGERYQQTLYLFEKKNGKLESAALLPTLFVPMTGAAEASRAVLPDPSKPIVANGGFEEVTPGTDQAAGWHYQRQMKLITDANDVPQGKNYMTFSNQDMGRGSQALQGTAIDGRKIGELQFSMKVKATNVRPGTAADEMAMLIILFYDANRGQLPTATVGPWRGSFDWEQYSEKVRVPPQAREAIFRVGLNGATGELSLDDIQMKTIPR